MRKSLILLFGLPLMLTGCTGLGPWEKIIAPENTTGTVFHDRNRNGVRDRGEPGISGVRVSNGQDIVLTDTYGRYQLDIQKDTSVFVIKPRNWMTLLNEMNLPRFFYVHRPDGSPEGLKYPDVTPTPGNPVSIDFALYRRPEPKRFDVVVFGDTQTSRSEEINYLSHDAIEEVAGFDAAFGISLGDIVGNNIGDFQKVNEAIALIGLPWYNVPGNHDMNFYSHTDEYSLETYNRIYGPPYYSFDYGPIHFLMLDSIIAYKGEKETLVYHEGLDAKQLEFIRNDLALLDKDQLVVLSMHGPENQFKQNRRELFEILEKHPRTLSVAGHDHQTMHLFLDSKYDWHGSQPHHLYISGAVSGAWWTGFPDETGIPHAMMTNGVPNGYSVISFNGRDYKIRFKAFRRPADYQMNIWAPEEVLAQEAPDTEVLVNVFAGSERSRVEMKFTENGKWVLMGRLSRKDPYFLALRKLEDKYNFPRVSWSKDASNSRHVWRANLPEDVSKGAHLIHIRSKDMFGEVHTGKRLIRIK